MIFSDNYTVHERYSVLRQERICTYSEMPWAYTPLVDNRYKPNTILTSTKDNLNAVLDFEYLIKEREVIKKEYNILGILHDNDDIISYETRFVYRYCTVQEERKYFIDKTNTKDLDEVYRKIDEIVKPTPIGSTQFYGMKHDINGIATDICIYDRYYDVSSYQNSMLTSLNEYSRKNINYCRGILCIGKDNKVSMKMGLYYPKVFYQNTTNKSTEHLFKSSSRINVSYQQGVDRHLYGMRYYNFLTDEQATYIAKLCEDMSKDFMFDLEFIFDGSDLVDIICSRILYKEFEEIEVKKGIIPWYKETV